MLSGNLPQIIAHPPRIASGLGTSLHDGTGGKSGLSTHSQQSPLSLWGGGGGPAATSQSRVAYDTLSRREGELGRERESEGLLENLRVALVVV